MCGSLLFSCLTNKRSNHRAWQENRTAYQCGEQDDIMQCNQNLLFYKTLPFLQSLFSTSKSIKIYWGWFHQDIKAFLRVSAGRVMQKGSKNFPGYRRDFSDSSGLHPDYCFIFFRGEIVHWAHILTVTSKALLSAEGQQAETTLASPELLKIQGE